MSNPKPAKTPLSASVPSSPAPALWRPDWRWHLKTLGAIYAVLAVVYALVTGFLSKAPAPYGLRDIPQDMTPWLKK